MSVQKMNLFGGGAPNSAPASGSGWPASAHLDIGSQWVCDSSRVIRTLMAVGENTLTFHSAAYAEHVVNQKTFEGSYKPYIPEKADTLHFTCDRGSASSIWIDACRNGDTPETMVKKVQFEALQQAYWELFAGEMDTPEVESVTNAVHMMRALFTMQSWFAKGAQTPLIVTDYNACDYELVDLTRDITSRPRPTTGKLSVQPVKGEVEVGSQWVYDGDRMIRTVVKVSEHLVTLHSAAYMEHEETWEGFIDGYKRFLPETRLEEPSSAGERLALDIWLNACRNSETPETMAEKMSLEDIREAYREIFHYRISRYEIDRMTSKLHMMRAIFATQYWSGPRRREPLIVSDYNTCPYKWVDYDRPIPPGSSLADLASMGPDPERDPSAVGATQYMNTTQQQSPDPTQAPIPHMGLADLARKLAAGERPDLEVKPS